MSVNGMRPRFAAVRDSHTVIAQPKGGLAAGKRMRKLIGISKELNKPSPFRYNILIASENLAETTLKFGNLSGRGILECTGAPMLNEIIAFVLPRAGGK